MADETGVRDIPCRSAASVLLIHGAGGGGWEWALWRAVLEARGHVVAAPDLMPAAGGLAATGLQDYIDQMRACLVRLPRRRVVVGASLGGAIAMHLAADADAMVLVNPLPPAPFQGSLPRHEWPDVVGWRRHARLASTRRAMMQSDDASALFAFRHWRDESGRVLREASSMTGLARPAVPVLCIASGRDTDVPAAATRALAQAWDATLVEWPEAGHLDPLLGRQAARWAADVATWLSTR